ncbi:MAG: hypothetical protein ACP5D0_00950 [Hydrogenovibrio sp.]
MWPTSDHPSERLQHWFPQRRLSDWTPLPAAFADSSHQVWLYDDGQTRDVVKLMACEPCAAEGFWGGMKALFAVTLPQQLAQFERLYPRVAQASELAIPLVKRLLRVTTVGNDLADHSLTLGVQTDFLPGLAVSPQHITEPMVRTLARHLAALHQAPVTLAEREALQQTFLPGLANWLTSLVGGGVSASEVAGLQQQVASVGELGALGLIMPDLRWDQFLQQDGRLTGLTDLDAIVAGPVAFEWVLLELLLTAKAFDVLCDEYQKWAPIPSVTDVREVYRAALFGMNVLGGTNYQAWQNRPLRL